MKTDNTERHMGNTLTPAGNTVGNVPPMDLGHRRSREVLP